MANMFDSKIANLLLQAGSKGLSPLEIVMTLTGQSPWHDYDAMRCYVSASRTLRTKYPRRLEKTKKGGNQYRYYYNEDLLTCA